MIQAQIKLRIKFKQKEKLNEWLLILTSVWNWAIKKIEADTENRIFYSKQEFQNLLANHGKKLGIPSHTLQGMLVVAWDSWQRCFKKISKKPRLKGIRNQLNTLPFPDPIRKPDGIYIKIPGLGSLRFHKQEIPKGKIKCARIIKRSSGWYLCLFIDASPTKIVSKDNKIIGIDPGFKSTLALSTGETINKPKRLLEIEKRLGQSQRGKNKKLTARLHERIRNRRKDDNHKLSRRLVEENETIVFSKDNIKEIAKSYGRSVAEASHYQLRQMLSYKCTTSGRKYIEVASKGSTMTCSYCLAKTGPTGKAGLSVRQWECIECGILHDRDHNAAVNTLLVGLGTSLEVYSVRNPLAGRFNVLFSQAKQGIG
jgi:IS605 OrfB family transposase